MAKAFKIKHCYFFNYIIYFLTKFAKHWHVVPFLQYRISYIAKRLSIAKLSAWRGLLGDIFLTRKCTYGKKNALNN